MDNHEAVVAATPGEGVTHTGDDPDAPPVLLPARLAEFSPDTDFSTSYRMSRLFRLSPDQKSFLFKLRQNLLPTRERLHRARKSPTPSCSFCDDEKDSLEHIIACPYTSDVATLLLAWLTT